MSTAGHTVVRAVRSLGVELKSECGHHGRCGLCKVKLVTVGADSQGINPPLRTGEQIPPAMIAGEQTVGFTLACQQRIHRHGRFPTCRGSSEGLARTDLTAR